MTFAGHAIQTEGLTRRYGLITAVDGLNLHVPTGSVYGFLGPNGAGKTTTIRMLMGLIRPDAGTARIFGQALREHRESVLSGTGALVEAPSIYGHLTGRQNLEVTRRLKGVSAADVDKALQVVRLTDAAGRTAREYSLGMKQRLALALAFLGGARLLVLDEPTNGLDPAGIREIRELLRSLPVEHGITVFLSSHLLGEVEQIATHIGIIAVGRLLFQGTLEELQRTWRARAIVEVSSPEAALGVLRTGGWEADQDGGGGLRVSVEGKEDLAKLNALLVGRGHNVYRLGLEERSLEASFLQLTHFNTRGDAGRETL